MNLIGIMPARNEAWIIGASLRATLLWCDKVIVLDHASTDTTADIVKEVQKEQPGRVILLEEKDPPWREMAHRQTLLELARTYSATHVAIVDADEILAGDMLPTIRGHIEKLNPGGLLRVAMRAMWRSIDQYRVGESIWANRYDLSLAFRDSPELNWAPTKGYDHHHRHPHGSYPQATLRHPHGGVMHLQFADWRRLVAKHARYKMDERIKYPSRPVQEIDTMYSLALDEKRLELDDAPADWWGPYMDSNVINQIHLDTEPWQERQCKEWMAEYGTERFKGLNLFGVC